MIQNIIDDRKTIAHYNQLSTITISDDIKQIVRESNISFDDDLLDNIDKRKLTNSNILSVNIILRELLPDYNRDRIQQYCYYITL